MRRRPPPVAFVATAASSFFGAALSVRRRPRAISALRAPRASADEEIFVRRAAERAQSQQQQKIASPSKTASPSSSSSSSSDAASGAALGPDAEFVIAPDAAALPGAPVLSPKSDGAARETQRVPVLRSPGFSRMARTAREGVVRLAQENSFTGNLRLPTGSEAMILAWEAVMVAALIALLRAGVSSTLRWIHNRLSASSEGEAVPYEASVFECMQRPLESASIFTVATALAEAVSRPLAATGLLRYVRTLRELGLIFCATWFLLRWIDRIRVRFAVDKRIDKTQVDATSRIATVATTAISVLISLDTVGINVQTVLAFGGIGGVAIGFAGREIISNFFGGFMIYVTRPFMVGEWIRSIEETELNGTVEDIGWYLTRVRTWDKRPLYIPNSRFSTLIVENGSRMANRRILHTLDLRHEDIPVLPKIVADLTKMLMANTELDPRQHRMAYVDAFGTYSAKVWLSCYTKSVFLYDYRRVQQEVLLNAHEIIRAHGARLATSTTRDVRPGIDTDKYGPYGPLASFKSPSGEPKVGVTPAPPRFKISDIPGAPYFSSMHAEDALRNIESGISEEAIAAALRAEMQYSKQEPTSPPPRDAPVPTNAKQAAAASTEQNARSTSEAAVVAAAAALAAARRNASRIEDRGAAGKDAATEQRSSKETPVTAQTGTGQMKISAVSKPRTGSESAPQVVTSSTSPGAVQETGAETGTGAGTTSGSGEKAEYSANAAGTPVVSATTGNGTPSGTMKITAVRKTKGSPPEKTESSESSPENAERPTGITGTSNASSHAASAGGSSGTMKITSVRKTKPSPPQNAEPTSGSTDAVPRVPSGERVDDGRGQSAAPVNPVTTSKSTGGGTSGSGTMKISAVRKTKGSPPEKAEDVAQRQATPSTSGADGATSMKPSAGRQTKGSPREKADDVVQSPSSTPNAARADSGSSMKISGVRQTKGYPPEKAEDVAQGPSPTPSAANADGGASMKISGVRQTKGYPPKKAEDVTPNPSPTATNADGGTSMKISGVRQTKGYPPEKAADVTQSPSPTPSATSADGDTSMKNSGVHQANGPPPKKAEGVIRGISSSPSTGGADGTSMKISGVRQTKGSPPDKADVVQSSSASPSVTSADDGSSGNTNKTGSNGAVEKSSAESASMKMTPMRKSKGSAEQPSKGYENPDSREDLGERPEEKEKFTDTN